MDCTIYLQIICPHCHNKSRIDADKVPHGNYRVTCHQCDHAFRVDRGSSLNCQIDQEEGSVEVHFDPKVLDWHVRHPCCQGFDYNVAGLGALIRAGIIHRNTMVKPPNSEKYKAATNFDQLAFYFNQVDQDLKREEHKIETKSDSVDKPWYQQGASDVVRSIFSKELTLF